MSKKDNNLEKICSHCGQFKPLSAFLQLDDTRHVVYGTICATCRKPFNEEQAQLDEEGLSGHSTEHKIDAKFIAKNEKEKIKLNKEIETNYFQNRDEHFLEQERDAEKEKQNRQEQLVKEQNQAKQKTSFLDSKQAAAVLAPEKIPGSEAQKAQEGKIDLQHDVKDTQIAGKIKHQGYGFLHLRNMLGDAAPIARAARQAKEHANVGKQSGEVNATKNYINRMWDDKQKQNKETTQKEVQKKHTQNQRKRFGLEPTPQTPEPNSTPTNSFRKKK